MRHDMVVEAAKRILLTAESQDARILYQAAVNGIPDGNLALAIDQAMRHVYEPHVLRRWRVPGDADLDHPYPYPADMQRIQDHADGTAGEPA